MEFPRCVRRSSLRILQKGFSTIGNVGKRRSKEGAFTRNEKFKNRFFFSRAKLPLLAGTRYRRIVLDIAVERGLMNDIPFEKLICRETTEAGEGLIHDVVMFGTARENVSRQSCWRRRVLRAASINPANPGLSRTGIDGKR